MSQLNGNPLLDWTERPAFDQIQAEHVAPAIVKVLDECENALRALEEDPPLSWKGLMPRLEHIEDRVSRVWGVVNHLHAVRNNEALRRAHAQTLPQVIAFFNRYSQSRPIFEALTSLKESRDWESFDSAQRRIIEGNLKNAALAGVGLQGEALGRFNTIAARLGEIQTKFSNNVLDATKAYQLVLTEPEEIDGLPPTLLALAAQTACGNGHEAATAETGPWVFTLDLPCYLPFLQYSKRRDLRQEMYLAYNQRASSGELDNHPYLVEILRLRQEQAKLLGFDNYAELSLDRKMAGSVEAVLELLEELRSASLDAGKKDVADLVDLARRANAPEAEDLRPWDYFFWAERLREEKFSLIEEELRPYFPLPQVLDGMFDIVHHLFGIHVIPADGETPVWHKDVRYFHVQDEDGEVIASFFLDPYSRPAEKRGGAWMDVLVQRSNVVADPGKKLRLPIAYMNCNQSPPVGDKPSLMTFSEVTTLFHEFGHALQHMLTRVDYGMASGLANVEWDAIEIASQFMENWCYHRATLKSMARHFETGEPLPDHQIDRLQAARTFQAGFQTLRQVHFGLFDMTLHTGFDPDRETVETINRQILAKTAVLPPVEKDRFYCGFNHIFSGGYAAGYYSYKWSEVLSADAFSAFIEAGLADQDAVRQLGRKFRDTILALGGSRHPMEVFTLFRGRKPSVEALLKQDGLI